MKKSIKIPLYLFVTAILVFGLTVSLQSLLLAWSEPDTGPPGGVLPAVGKWKIGSDPTELYYDDGNIGINTNDPGERLEVNGNIQASGSICSDGGTNCIGSGIQYSACTWICRNRQDGQYMDNCPNGYVVTGMRTGWGGASLDFICLRCCQLD